MTLCEYCNVENKEENLRGLDGIVYDGEENKYCLYIEHFRNEKYRIEVKYCPECGRELAELD